MTEASALGFAGQQKAATAFLGTVLESGADPLLKAQADLLESVALAMTDWMQRRQEAVVEAQRLIARLQTVASPAEMLKTQQEWMAGAFQRMNADAIAYQASATQLLEKSRHWVGRSVETAADASAPQANARPAGSKPVVVVRSGIRSART
jgi:hypothetical protein